MKAAILGAGNIANMMAKTLAAMDDARVRLVKGRWKRTGLNVWKCLTLKLSRQWKSWMK